MKGYLAVVVLATCFFFALDAWFHSAARGETRPAPRAVFFLEEDGGWTEWLPDGGAK